MRQCGGRPTTLGFTLFSMMSWGFIFAFVAGGLAEYSPLIYRPAGSIAVASEETQQSERAREREKEASSDALLLGIKNRASLPWAVIG
jgi:hypothetical protein